MNTARGRGGIKAHLLRKARRSEVPSTKGPCESCNEPGTIRYFVAAKLPRPIYLCDRNYLKVRDALEKALTEILKGIELF